MSFTKHVTRDGETLHFDTRMSPTRIHQGFKIVLKHELCLRRGWLRQIAKTAAHNAPDWHTKRFKRLLLIIAYNEQRQPIGVALTYRDRYRRWHGYGRIFRIQLYVHRDYRRRGISMMLYDQCRRSLRTEELLIGYNRTEQVTKIYSNKYTQLICTRESEHSAQAIIQHPEQFPRDYRQTMTAQRFVDLVRLLCDLPPRELPERDDPVLLTLGCNRIIRLPKPLDLQRNIHAPQGMNAVLDQYDRMIDKVQILDPERLIARLICAQAKANAG